MQIPETDFYTRALVGLLGVAFPILFQLVSKLDDKYSSTLVVELFDKELAKRLFIRLLIASLILVGVDTMKFTPLFYTNIGWLDYLIAHSADLLVILSVVCLLVSFFFYVNKILKYYTPNKFVEYLKEKYQKEKGDLVYLQAIGDVYIHCIKKEYETLSMTIWLFLVRENRAFKEKSGTQPIVYPDAYYAIQHKAVQEIASLGNRRNRQLEHRIGSQNLLLGAIEDPPLSVQTYKWVWYNVDLAISYKNDALVVEYWKAAHQHCSFRFDLTQASPELQAGRQKERSKFLEFHIALGGLLLFTKRYECLNMILTYSSSEPASYPLLPKNTTEIFEYYFKFLNPSEYQFSFISQLYPFPGLDGTQGDNVIKRWIGAYLTLLFIRQYSLNTYYVYQDHLQLPAIPQSQSEKRFWINYIPLFETRLKEILANTELIKTLNFEFLTPAWAAEKNVKYPIEYLASLKRHIEESFEQVENNQLLFPGKVELFKANAGKIIEKAIKPFLELNNPIDIAEGYTAISVNGLRWITDKDSFAENPAIHNLNYETVFASSFAHHIMERLSSVFVLMQPKSFIFKLTDMFTAIGNLKLDENFIIIMFGINIRRYINEFSVKGLDENSFFGVDLISFNQRLFDRRSIFIMKKNDLPKIIVKDPSEEEKQKYELSEVDEQLKLYVSVIDLNLKPEIRTEIVQERGNNEAELIKSALMYFAISLEVRWKNDAKILRFNEHSEYEQAGNPNNIDEISTFEEMFNKPVDSIEPEL